jgi:exodeoxyribonuclease VII small subunit
MPDRPRPVGHRSAVAKAERRAAEDVKALSFEQILERLQLVVEQLEDGEIPLEQALLKFEQGVALSRAGQQRLDDAERRIEVLLGNDDGLTTEPLTDEESEDE